MKKIIVLLSILAGAITLQAQSVIGKWKLTSIDDPTEGKITVSDSVAFYKSFWDGATAQMKEEGKEMSGADSLMLIEVAKESFSEMNNYFMQFNANKTYKGSIGKKSVSGVYTYNPATKKMGRKAKGNTKYTFSKVTIENGQMVVEVTDENITLYFDKVK